MVVFDFHDVMYREVKVVARKKTAAGKYTAGKQKTAARNKPRSASARSTGTARTAPETERQAFNTSMGFSMPNMGAVGGMAY